MRYASIRESIAGIAARFGLTMAEAADGHSYSLLFTGEAARAVVFREVLGHIVTEHNVTHQFAPSDSGIPGIYARGMTLPDGLDSLYLVVVGDPDAAQYVPMPAATRAV